MQSLIDAIFPYWPYILIIVVFYLLIILPNSRAQKKKRDMLTSLQVGDNIVTIGGIYGTIVDIDGGKVTVKVADKTHITFVKGAVDRKLKPESEKKETKEE